MLIVLRVLVGLSFTNSVLGMDFFVHQRGRMMGSYLLMSFSGIHLTPAVRFNLIYFFPNPRLARMWHLKWVGMDYSNWSDLCCSIKILHGSTHISHWFIINGSFQDVLIFFLSDMLFQRPDRTLTLNDPCNKDLLENSESTWAKCSKRRLRTCLHLFVVYVFWVQSLYPLIVNLTWGRFWIHSNC